jgi:HAD superfamily hydrolase (TIGR01457 family)
MSPGRYRAILADMDGTMNKGKTLIPGAEEVYRELGRAGVRWLFISNNATALPADLAAGIRDLGLPVEDDQVINSADALIRGIVRERPDARVLVVGEPRLVEGLVAAGIEVVGGEGPSEIVVTAMDRGFNYEKLRLAQKALLDGAAFWATNRDASLPVENGFLPGAGSIVAAVAAATGREPDRVFGKPSREIASIALETLDLPARSCLMVGDRMETDILCAHNAGIDSALVLTGASAREDLSRFDFAPDHVIESVADLPLLLEGRLPAPDTRSDDGSGPRVG